MASKETRLPNQELENVEIRFRNFSGKPDAFNTSGKREFHVVLSDEDAEAMRRDGWNVKEKPGREEGDAPTQSIKVEVSYKARPPRVVMISSSGRTNLDEKTVSVLDHVDIQNVDVILNPYHWEMPSGATGIKAYLQSIYVTIKEDRFERKYSDRPVAEQPRQDEWAR